LIATAVLQTPPGKPVETPAKQSIPSVVRRRAFLLRHLAGVTVVGTLVAVMPSHSAQAQSRPGTTDEALQKRLKKFPAADTDGDGVLTESEARAARKAGRSA
jgi:hypothetical protein